MMSLIVAVGRNSVIGKDNKLLWSLPEDMKYFRQKTNGKIVIMGRKTFDSIGKPLTNRINIILTRDESFHVKGCYAYRFIDDVLDEYDNYAVPDEEFMIIGGSTLYQQFLPYADRIYMTFIDHEFAGDSYFPQLNEEWEVVSSVKGIKDDKNPYDYYFNVLERRTQDMEYVQNGTYEVSRIIAEYKESQEQ